MGNKRKGKRTPGMRLMRALTSIFMVLAVLVSAGAVGFLILQISGKNSLYSRGDGTVMAAALAELTVDLEDSAGEEEDWQEGDLRYNGIHYRYNNDILTFLFMGIDRMTEVQPGKDGIDGGQSDALFLLVMNLRADEIQVIGIPRDTMADIDVYDREGNYEGTGRGQITLQHGYGDGAELSCERSVAAVSKLFYGLPIHGYCAVNMGAIPLLNDAVGGIELDALETMNFTDFRVEEGEHIRLEGMDAYYYLHNRDTKSFNSAGRRLERQKQYLTAYFSAAVESVKADITFPVTLYNTLSRYMVTDISLDEVSYLATQAASCGFGGMNSLKGETVMGERFEEFHADEEALVELVIEVFYEEVH